MLERAIHEQVNASLSATLSRTTARIAEEMAEEILKDPVFRARMRELVTRAFDAAIGSLSEPAK